MMGEFPSILELIPQRPPFLFVDTIKSFDKNAAVVQTSLNITGSEDYFKGHFPGRPVMPGVLMQEALFQSAGILMALLAGPDDKSHLGVIARIQNAKFKNMAIPPGVLEMEVKLLEKYANAYIMKAASTYLGKLVLSLEFTVAAVES